MHIPEIAFATACGLWTGRRLSGRVPHVGVEDAIGCGAGSSLTSTASESPRNPARGLKAAHSRVGPGSARPGPPHPCPSPACSSSSAVLAVPGACPWPSASGWPRPAPASLRRHIVSSRGRPQGPVRQGLQSGVSPPAHSSSAHPCPISLKLLGPGEGAAACGDPIPLTM